MRIPLHFLAFGLSVLITGCQTPLLRDGLFAKKSDAPTSQTESSKSSKLRNPNASSRADQVAKAPVPLPKQSSADPRVTAELSKGNTAIEQKRFTEARLHFETVLKSEPNNTHAHHMLGRVSDQQSQFEESERHYLAALSAQPNDPNLLCDIGYSYFLQGRHDESKDYLQRALAQQPGHQMALMNLAAVHVDVGDNQQAMAYYQQVAPAQQAERLLAAELNRKLLRRKDIASSQSQAAENKTPKSLQELNSMMAIERERANASRDEIRRLEDEILSLQARIAQRDHAIRARAGEQSLMAPGQGLPTDPNAGRQRQFAAQGNQQQPLQNGYGRGAEFNNQLGSDAQSFRQENFGQWGDPNSAPNFYQQQQGQMGAPNMAQQAPLWGQGQQPNNQYPTFPQQSPNQFGFDAAPNNAMSSNWDPTQQSMPNGLQPGAPVTQPGLGWGAERQNQFANIPQQNPSSLGAGQWTPQGIPLLPNQNDMQQTQFQQLQNQTQGLIDSGADNARRAMALGMGAGSVFQLPGTTNMEAQRPTYAPPAGFYQQPDRMGQEAGVFLPQQMQMQPNQYKSAPPQNFPLPNTAYPNSSVGQPDPSGFRPMQSYAPAGSVNRNAAPMPSVNQPNVNGWQGNPVLNQPPVQNGPFRQ